MNDMKFHYKKDISCVLKKDVAIVGGGPTGIPAAIAAGRSGADTILIEQRGMIGGQINQEMPFIGFFDSQGKQIIKGIGDEIIQRLVTLKASPGHIIDEHEASLLQLMRVCLIMFVSICLKKLEWIFC